VSSAGAIDPGARIGHVHLKVADLERALAFYTGVLGFRETQRYGRRAAFVAAGDYHHHIGLNTWESAGGASGLTGAEQAGKKLDPMRRTLTFAMSMRMRPMRARGGPSMPI
jgi:catechol-2,3-dioxygenase